MCVATSDVEQAVCTLTLGPLQVEGVRHAGDEEVLVVAGVAQQEQADVVDQLRVGQQVEREVRAHAAAAEQADRSVEALGHVAGAFQRLPAHLVELAVLRVEDARPPSG
jgi:hypothetical protein